VEVHKPKPWHGWREFLKEYLIIVVGVLTALAAEQVAESFREHRVANEAREAVRSEIAADLGWMLRRREEQGCDDRRLEELSALLTAAREGRAYQTPQWIGRTLKLPVSSRRWTAASQAGRATMFAPEEQGRYATLYYTLDGYDGHQDQEQVAWATLRTLEGAKTLSPPMIWGLSEALTRARLESYMIKRATTRSLTAAHAMGILPMLPPRSPDDVKRYPTCLPMDTDRATALRLVGNPTGEP
jgi:hypothetical protein